MKNYLFIVFMFLGYGINSYADFTIGFTQLPIIVGQQQTYGVTGAPPNTAIFWNLYFTPLGGKESLLVSEYNGRTDANGNATIVSGTYTPSLIGHIRNVATIGNQTNSVDFDCFPSNNLVSVSRSVVYIGQTQTYTVIGGPSNTPILWKLYLTPPGGHEFLYVNQYYGQTDANGNATVESGVYNSSLIGDIRVVAVIGNKAGIVYFSSRY